MKRLTVNGQVFECIGAGEWRDVPDSIVCYHVMQGTPHECWEAYNLPEGMDGEMIGQALTLKELLHELTTQPK